MDYTTLGRTGLRVSVAGLGCGGSSRLGLGTGKTEADAIALIRVAHDLGVNLFDTAASYGTEAVVGRALEDLPRDRLVITTKATIGDGSGGLAPEAVVRSLDNSLKALRTDYIDVFQYHGVPPALYDHVRDVITPVLLKERDKGKFRHLGLTETAPRDHHHVMLERALDDDPWDTVMLGFNMMHQNARTAILPRTTAQHVGTLFMFVVRAIFARPDQLRATLRDLAGQGQVPAALAEAAAPLDFLIHDGGAATLTDAAYRFARHEPGADVILFGTGDQAHLRANVGSILKPPLPDSDRQQVRSLFGHLVGIGLELPNRAGR